MNEREKRLSDEVDLLASEAEQLRAEVKELERAFKSCQGAYTAIFDRMKASEKDADRYNWLRNYAGDIKLWADGLPYASGLFFDQMVDNAIERDRES